MQNSSKQIYEGFWISIIIKGIISLGEMLAGLVVILVPATLITGTVVAVAHSGFVGGANGFIANELLKAVGGFTQDTQKIVALYLFSRGLIKVLLIGALIRNKLWAYPASLVVLGLFVLYQLYEIIVTHSIIISVITLFDLIVMYFVWREYKIVREHHGARKETFETTGTE